MKILITGGAGFIGSHLADFYCARGDAVTILDNFTTGSEANLNAINFQGKKVQGDIRDKELAESLISDSDLNQSFDFNNSNLNSQTLINKSINIRK